MADNRRYDFGTYGNLTLEEAAYCGLVELNSDGAIVGLWSEILQAMVPVGFYGLKFTAGNNEFIDVTS